jgi:DNA polymerase III epsilon subunit-like protein
MYLVFDMETTGLPASREAPIWDVDNWPRVVQLAWEAFDTRGRKTGARSSVIRPDGFKIPKDAERIHGISTLIAKRTGVPVAEALDAFVEALSKAAVVAHNFEFDAKVLRAEFYRRGIRNPFHLKTHVCTMKAATDYCALPGRYGFKWPTLPELHFKLFGKKVKETHDAAADVATCSKCFFELKRLGVVRVRRRARR